MGWGPRFNATTSKERVLEGKASRGFERPGYYSTLNLWLDTAMDRKLQSQSSHKGKRRSPHLHPGQVEIPRERGKNKTGTKKQFNMHGPFNGSGSSRRDEGHATGKKRGQREITNMRKRKKRVVNRRLGVMKTKQTKRRANEGSFGQ